MKISLISVGTPKDAPLAELTSRFAARIPRYMPFEHTALPDIRNVRSLAQPAIKQREGDAILARITPGDFVVLFDERGREMTSRNFADFIMRKASTLPRNLVFVIGGPYGFSQAVYDRADMLMSFSQMTFTHEMALAIATEQIYRAMTIIKCEPYHHD